MRQGVSVSRDPNGAEPALLFSNNAGGERRLPPGSAGITSECLEISRINIVIALTERDRPMRHGVNHERKSLSPLMARKLKQALLEKEKTSIFGKVDDKDD